MAAMIQPQYPASVPWKSSPGNTNGILPKNTSPPTSHEIIESEQGNRGAKNMDGTRTEVWPQSRQ